MSYRCCVPVCLLTSLVLFLGLMPGPMPAQAQTNSPSAPTLDSGPLAPPTGVEASDCEYTDRVRVTWNAVSGATRYQVVRATTTGPIVICDLVVRLGFLYQCDDATAASNVPYQYTVRAYLLFGGWTGYGTLDQGIRKGSTPAPPTGVQASDGNRTTGVRVVWNESDGFNRYAVGRDRFEPTWVRETDGSPYDDTTAVCSTRYNYWVRGRDLCGQWSDWGTPDEGYRQATKPAEPENLAASYCTYPDKVRITWDPVDCATEYVLRRHTERFPLTPKEEVYSDGDTAFDDTDVDPGRTYYYWAYACNEAGCQGTEGLPASGRACPAPTNVQATDCTYPDKVRVTWSSVPSASKYQIFRASSSGGAKTKVGQVSAPATSFDDTSATPDNTYHYWVKACFDSACNFVGAYSTADTGEACSTPADAPSNVEATDCTYPDKVRITWNSVPGATKYRIYRATSSGGAKTKIGEVSAPATSFDDTNATPNTTYHYWVKACLDASCSRTSAFSTPDTGKACCEAPPVPSNLDASDGTYTDKIHVTWDGVAGATHYEVYRAASLSGSKTKIASPAGTWLDDTSATCGSIYYYWAAACNDCGCSDLSEVNLGFCGAIPEGLNYIYLPLVLYD